MRSSSLFLALEECAYWDAAHPTAAVQPLYS
jgi:hypothetical protein